MRKMIITGLTFAAAIGLTACNESPPPPADEAVTTEVPVEPSAPDAAMTSEAPVPAEGATTPPADAAMAAPAATGENPEGAAPSSSTGARVTPPSQ
jgi:hypothetical protein